MIAKSFNEIEKIWIMIAWQNKLISVIEGWAEKRKIISF